MRAVDAGGAGEGVCGEAVNRIEELHFRRKVGIEYEY